MAVKWAIIDGSFQSGTTWNDGVAPASGDTCYLNGHTLSLTTLNINIGDGLISNATNDDLGVVGGGTLTHSLSGGVSPTYTLRCNLECYSGYLFTISIPFRQGGLFVTYGNYRINSGAVLFAFDSGTTNQVNTTFGWTHTGNIEGDGTFIIRSGNNNWAILNGLSVLTGNISVKMINAGMGVFPTATINGNLTLSATLSNIATLTLNGALTTIGNVVFAGTTLNINGSIYYSSNNNTTGVRVPTLNILNPDSFRWKDTAGNNPFIIVTRADIQDETNYPNEDRVVQGTDYAYNQLHGRFVVDYPPEPVVLKDYVYDSGNMTGTLETISVQADYPNEDDVRFDVPFDFGNKSGKCHVPIPEDVREGIPVDVNEVGTLIPSSGGDRLRIADFGYYTRSTSITYIVDLTESDKPAFADCEEIVLRSLFPTLDLDNIPDKFFDDLFVQFLRYRLLVEYYRGTSINSKFTPSEPTAEIVNYANTKCEYWLNTANLFLQLWGEKYPNSVKKDRILL